jgi:hypothetical protein
MDFRRSSRRSKTSLACLRELGVLLVADHDADLALVDDGVELGLDLGVEHLADVAQAEAGLVVGLVDAHADHVALAGVHDALDAVEELVDLALEDGLEVGLHGLAVDLDQCRRRKSWSRRGSRRAPGRRRSIL